MKQIYVSHSPQREDYEASIYEPLRNCVALKEYEFLWSVEIKKKREEDLLPPYLTEDFYHWNDFQLFFAEISMSSTHLGIELVWASRQDIPIVGFYRKGVIIDPILYRVANALIEYEDSTDMANKFVKYLRLFKDYHKELEG